MSTAPAQEDVIELSPTGDEYMSPSRMEKVDSCLRAYFFRYPQRTKEPEKESAAFGTIAHRKLQFYMLTKVMPDSELVQIGKKQVDAGVVTRAGLQYIPFPHDSIKTEHEFEIEAFTSSAHGRAVWFRGVVDVYDRTRVKHVTVREDGTTYESAFEIGDWSDDGEKWDAYDSRGNPIPLVEDHKTTGDFKWQKTSDALRASDVYHGDPQPAFYGLNAIKDFVDTYGYEPEWIHFRWVYYLRDDKNPKARCTDLRLKPDEIRASCERWKPYAEAAIALHDLKKSKPETTGNDVPPTVESCKKFGGCGYGPPTHRSPNNLNICRLTNGERMRAAMTTSIPIADQVRAALAGGATAPAGANPFMSPNPPEASAANAANPFGAAPPAATAAASNPFGAPAATPPAAASNPFAGVSFGGSAPAATPPAAAPLAAPVVSNPFAGIAIGTPSVASAAPAVAANPFGGIAVTVDPRLAECHPSVDASQRVAYLAHCDKHNLDHRTGQPKSASPAVMPAAASNPAEEIEALKSLALRMYTEKRRPDASTHPQVVKFFEALEMINGPIAAPVAATPIVETPAKKRGRKKKDAGAPAMNADGTEQDDVDVMREAFKEIGNFFLSLAVKYE